MRRCAIRQITVLLLLLHAILVTTAIGHDLLNRSMAPQSYDGFRAQLDQVVPDLMQEDHSESK